MRLFIHLAIRNFLKSASLNALNMLGLSAGIVAALLIIVYADHEYHYDQFHTKAGNIFRLEAKTSGSSWYSNIGVEHARELGSGTYPEVSAVVQVNRGERAFFRNPDGGRFPESDILQTNAGSRFFEVFDFEVKHGNPDHLLDEPNALVLTESKARKYFGDSPAVGKTIYYDTIPLKVTGVLKDLPSDTHFDFDFLRTNPNWNDGHYHVTTYLELVPDANPVALNEKILKMDVAYNEYHELTDAQLMPVEDIYLYSDAAFGGSGKGDLLQLKVLLVIGVLILLITVTNYLNLSLALYLGKGRAIGVRKVFGETKGQLVRALAGESFLMILLTLPVILLGFSLLLPGLNLFLDVRLGNKLLTSLPYILGTVSFLMVVSFLTVIFPAISLGNMPINTLLKSKSAMNITGGTRYRNGLIFLQLILLFTLGISGWFMNQQIQYLDNKDMGFDATGVIKVTNAYDIGSIPDYELFKQKLLANPKISGVAWGPMMGDGMNPLAYKVEGHTETMENLLSYGVDIDYFDVMGMEITHGDFKNVLHRSENGRVVSLVNQSFINKFGWQDDPLNKKIILRPGTEDELHRKVSGVFKDFHFYTLKEKITPQIISLRPDPEFVNTNLLIRHAPGANVNEIIAMVEDRWYEVQPNLPMQYELMDESVRRLYTKERQTGQISFVFSVLAMVLSIVGLVGFMIYIIGLKSKELTVRKVLGASLVQIIGVLNKQLWWIILIAGGLGSFLSYRIIDSWLQDYAYKITMNPLVFLGALVFVYLIVFSITAARSMKWARTNPVVTLNEE